MSRKTWETVLLEHNERLDVERKAYQKTIRFLECEVIRTTKEIKANNKDIEDIKKGK